MKLEHSFGQMCAGFGLGCILVATLTPIPGEGAASATTPIWCLICGDHGGVDVILNVLLFIPFALGLRAAGTPTRRVIVLAAGLSLFVESMQFEFIKGRDASLSDLLTNTMGGAIGAVLGAHLRLLAVPRAPGARALARGWATGWLALWAAAAWLLQPWAPAGGLQTAWGVDVPGHAVFQGRVRAVSGDLPRAPGAVPDTLDLPRHLAMGTFTFTVDVTTGQPRAIPAPIVALLHDDRLFGILYEVHDDLVLELPTHAHQLRLRAPALRLDAGLSAPGSPVSITAELRGRTLQIASTADGGSHQRRSAVALSPSFGWSLLLPFDYAYGPEVGLLTAVWLAALLLPLGYWAGRGWRPGWRIAAGLATVVAVGLGAIPWLTHYAPVHRSEWLAAAGGLTIGWALARAVAYLGRRCASPSTSEFCSS